MDVITLGRTDIRCSPVGLGAGGPSRLGQTAGHSADQSAAVVKRALELGVTLIDTSELYGTEEIVGSAIAGRRDEVVICTKGYPKRESRLKRPDELLRALDRSLGRLGTDHADVYFLHALDAEDYDEAVETLVPALHEARDAGKVRAIGVTEQFGADTGHRMLSKAAVDGVFDVVMVGFNLLNPSARDRVFPHTQANGVGTLIMFAVRRALSDPDKLRSTIASLVDDGIIAPDAIDLDDPLGFLRDCASSVTEAAYRFCRHEPGADVILTGTGNVAHLEENVAALSGPPLPDEVQAHLRDIFGAVDTVSAN